LPAEGRYNPFAEVPTQRLPLQQEAGTVLGAFAKIESVAAGFQWGLRFLSLMMLTLGLAVALLLWYAARALHAPPGAGYT